MQTEIPGDALAPHPNKPISARPHEAETVLAWLEQREKLNKHWKQQKTSLLLGTRCLSGARHRPPLLTAGGLVILQ
jgi:hypothetical protein